jgi:predicted enzyme related to lactoylglutathione lyase
MLEQCDLIAFVPANDLGLARTFYADVVGLPLVDANPAACVFDANGTMLRVTAVAELPAARYTVLGWAVADIGAAIEGLRERGVAFLRFDGMEQDELGAWLAPDGARIAWFEDPAGNTLSLTQFSA